jgi:SAGA-associated factor 29
VTLFLQPVQHFIATPFVQQDTTRKTILPSTTTLFFASTLHQHTITLTHALPASPLDRPKFQVGTEVLYRKKGVGKAVDPNEGEGMLCQVTSVIGEGKQRRYEIRDADAEAVESPTFRASLQQMTPIPALSATLPDIKAKTNVLALYPGTTTFYKAEVVLGKRREGDGPPQGHVKLRFEGEDDQEPDKDVERRYVLSDWTGK